MTDVDHALRDALDARAAAVVPDPGAYAAVLRRRERRRLARWTAPVAAAAATVAVVGAVAVATRPVDRPRPPAGQATETPAAVAPAAPPVPETLLAVQPVGSSWDGQGRVVDWRSLKGDAVAETAVSDSADIRAAAAVGDGKTFYAVATDACRNTLLRIEGTKVSDLGPLKAGWLAGLAVTRDGTKLAYTTAPVESAGNCMTVGDPAALPPRGDSILTVRTLATGEERHWTGDRLSTGAQLAWSPDGRTLAYPLGFTVVTVDTTAPGDRLPALDRSVTFRGREPDAKCQAEAPAYLSDGTLVTGYYCFVDGAEQETGVAPFDPATNTIGPALFRLPSDVRPHCVAFDRTGRHAFVCTETAGSSGDDEAKAVYEWHGGRDATPVDVSGLSPRLIAW